MAIVDAVFAPAAGDIVTLVDFGQQRGNVFGSVLQVAVHGDHHVAFGFVEPRREGRGLPEVAAQPDDLQVPVGLHQVRQQLETPIGGGVIHEQNLVRPLQDLEHAGEAVVEREEGMLLVVNRNHDGQH